MRDNKEDYAAVYQQSTNHLGDFYPFGFINTSLKTRRKATKSNSDKMLLYKALYCQPFKIYLREYIAAAGVYHDE